MCNLQCFVYYGEFIYLLLLLLLFQILEFQGKMDSNQEGHRKTPEGESPDASLGDNDKFSHYLTKVSKKRVKRSKKKVRLFLLSLSHSGRVVNINTLDSQPKGWWFITIYYCGLIYSYCSSRLRAVFRRQTEKCQLEAPRIKARQE